MYAMYTDPIQKSDVIHMFTTEYIAFLFLQVLLIYMYNSPIISVLFLSDVSLRV
jgi:hypothetical protein